MTTADEVRELVRGSEFHEWVPFADKGTWTYQGDVALRIVREVQIDNRYQQPWTSGIQGQNSRWGYYVYYGPSPVGYHVVVSVDDGRAHIPEPGSDGTGGVSISEYEANIGRIITGDRETFNAYLNRTNIAVYE